MKKIFLTSIFGFFTALFVLIISFKEPETKSNEVQLHNARQLNGSRLDILNIIYSIADREGMKVISDLNMAGGAWYGEISAEEMVRNMKNYINRYSARYGSHKSFWGWYLNNEINPIKTSQIDESAFWRKVFKEAVKECHKVRPGSIVTISPFFLLDRDALRGFEYLQPSEYEKWWSVTLKETGIDILMLQDSGEHQAFFTLAEREPFVAAFAKACEQSGAKFWVNVKSGQVDAKNWVEAIKMEKNRQKKWEFTPMNFLSQKLTLAARYGEGIVNWGYFPFMNPVTHIGPWPSNEVDGQEIMDNSQKEAYNDYKAYYKKLRADVITGEKCRPIIQGTLWWLQTNYDGWSIENMRKIIEQQIDLQKALGFDILWLVNTPANMNWAENTH